jgi:hypothetical protein
MKYFIYSKSLGTYISSSGANTHDFDQARRFDTLADAAEQLMQTATHGLGFGIWDHESLDSIKS